MAFRRRPDQKETGEENREIGLGERSVMFSGPREVNQEKTHIEDGEGKRDFLIWEATTPPGRGECWHGKGRKKKTSERAIWSKPGLDFFSLSGEGGRNVVLIPGPLVTTDITSRDGGRRGKRELA